MNLQLSLLLHFELPCLLKRYRHIKYLWIIITNHVEQWKAEKEDYLSDQFLNYSTWCKRKAKTRWSWPKENVREVVDTGCFLKHMQRTIILKFSKLARYVPLQLPNCFVQFWIKLPWPIYVWILSLWSKHHRVHGRWYSCMQRFRQQVPESAQTSIKKNKISNCSVSNRHKT